MDAMVHPEGGIIIGAPLMAAEPTPEPTPTPTPSPTASATEALNATVLAALESFRHFSGKYRASAGIVVGMIMVMGALALALLERTLRGRHTCRRSLARMAGRAFEAAVIGITVVFCMALFDLYRK